MGITMNARTTTPLRPSLRTLGGIAAIVGAVLVGTTSTPALAASATANDSEAASMNLAELGRHLIASRRQVTQRLATTLDNALDRSTTTVSEYHSTFEDIFTLGHGFERLMDLDEDEAEDTETASGSTPAPASDRRFEYNTDTNDPLAGI